MLSILIPIYDTNAYPLVEELWKQCISNKINFEILCQDDASKSILNKENEKINNLSNCSFIELEDNVAHRKNRNILAKNSKFEYLLFIDGDSKIISEKYIWNFISETKQYDVVYGGRVHSDQKPESNYLLRWKYGKYMEDQKPIFRTKNPFKCLLFNNTLIKRTLFEKVKFDDVFIKYGHDDTIFSYKLMQENASVFHINNPVQHEDLDTNDVFYNKMKQSLENLHEITNKNFIDEEYIKFTQVTSKLEKAKLDICISILYKVLEKAIKNNLIGNYPKLFVFNFFRLGYFCTLKIKYNESSNNK
ncbi:MULTISPECIES: glycosyltransferase family 2 protein [Flavobacterium]|uniref:Glycosyltransferase family 2 protein n=1 Tax=Flavobacterium jumunjinense TaxID=998845 RepID=A0ABV5GJL4_9FLAO|nr:MULTISPECIES: glycosyltransferase [Flavobacterium]